MGAAFWTVTKAMTAFKVLPDAVRQIVILVVGARFKAAYEIYAHAAVAKAKHEISDARLATLAAGERPGDLTEPEAAGYDVATALINSGVLPEPTYRHALSLFGQRGLAELIYLVGHYWFVSTTLNGFAIGVPDDAAANQLSRPNESPVLDAGFAIGFGAGMKKLWPISASVSGR
jgi:4-carboxymuconolactone decarboxylase